jgi:hypothetical protein
MKVGNTDFSDEAVADIRELTQEEAYEKYNYIRKEIIDEIRKDLVKEKKKSK